MTIEGYVLSVPSLERHCEEAQPTKQSRVVVVPQSLPFWIASLRSQ
jgi:hypothetical protein